MNVSEALREGRAILDELDLGHWNLTLDRAVRRLGVCRYSTRTISLSEPFVKLNTWDEVRTTILHEAAHAIAGPEAGHGWRWAVECHRLGIEARTCADGTKVAMPTGNVIVLCPTHGELGRQHRMPKRNARSYKVCLQCRSRVEYRRAG